MPKKAGKSKTKRKVMKDLAKTRNVKGGGFLQDIVGQVTKSISSDIVKKT